MSKVSDTTTPASSWHVSKKDDSVLMLGIHSTPSSQDLSKRTGLFHTVVWREEKDTIHLAFQPKDGKGSQHASPVLVAVKNSTKKGGYSIYSDHPKLTQLVGQLVVIRKTISYILYALYQDGIQVATILYRVPSILQVVRDGPPRQAMVSLSLEQNKKDLHWFRDACEIHILQTGSLAGLDNDSIATFCTKNPYVKADGRFGLNFNGRGRVASNQNMQLEQRQKHESKVICQMAKWESDVYHIDFGAPFTPLTAFGFCLAQLDL